MPFEMQKSILGRRLGVSSTGGLVSAVNSTGNASTDFTVAYQGWGEGMFTTHSSSEATLRNAGVNLISSATAAAYTFTVAAPVQGVGMEIISASSSTTITLQTSATTILFFDSTLILGATGLVISQASTDGGNVGAAVLLRGISATKWQVLSKPKSSSAAL